MLSSYGIYIRSKNGGFRDRLTDVTSLSIVEALNDVGSWRIKSTTPGKCPFQAGDGIVVYKNGEYYYSGMMTSIEETYDGYNGLYNWTASGQNDLVYLEWRVAYPDPATLNTTIDAYYTDTDSLGMVIKNLIEKNMGSQAIDARKLSIFDEVQVLDTGDSVSVSLRFQTLLESVQKLLNDQSFVIRCVWDPDMKKLSYIVSNSLDLSSIMIFSTDLNQITEMNYKMGIPQNYIITGGQGELTARAFAYAQDEDSISQWGRVEFFHDMRSAESTEIQADADAYLRKSAEENVGWAGTLNADDILSRYKKDWNIGDIVGVAMDGRTIVQRVLQVVTEVSYDSETIKPTIGTIDRGSFDVIFKRLAGMRSDVNQLQWANS